MHNLILMMKHQKMTIVRCKRYWIACRRCEWLLAVQNRVEILQQQAQLRWDQKQQDLSAEESNIIKEGQEQFSNFGMYFLLLDMFLVTLCVVPTCSLSWQLSMIHK
jgi:hypothetical protein